MSIPTLFADNDNNLLLESLTVQADGSAATGSSVTATIKDGTSVISGASDITLSATSGGSNDYRGTVSSTVDFTLNSRVTVEYSVTTSTGADGFWSVDMQVRKRV